MITDKQNVSRAVVTYDVISLPWVVEMVSVLTNWETFMRSLFHDFTEVSNLMNFFEPKDYSPLNIDKWEFLYFHKQVQVRFEISNRK